MKLDLPSLPASWRWCELREMCVVITDGDHQPPPRASEGVPLIVIGNLTGGCVDLSDTRHVPKAYFDDLPAWRRPAKGDVLYTLVGTFGLAVLVTDARPFCIQRHVGLLRPRVDVDRRYLLHLLNGPVTFHQAKEIATGTAQKTVPLGGLRSLKAPLAVLDEQHRIVAAIETHFSRLDAAVASLTRARANVKRARASVLKAAVEGRLVPTEAELARAEGRDYEPASALLERILAEREAAWAASGARGKYKEPVKPETEGLPDLPEGWCWASCDQAGMILLGRRRAPEYTGPLRAYLRVANVKDGRLAIGDILAMPFEDDEFEKYRLRPGDILVSEGQSPELVGQSAQYRGSPATCAFQATLHRFRPDPGSVDPSFAETVFRAWVRKGVFRRRCIITTNIGHLTLGRFQPVPFPLPPLPEQHRIVAEVDRRLSVLDALDATLDANLARCARLRQAILKRAFEGRLVPAEEPSERAMLLAAEPQPPGFAVDPSP